MWFVFCCGIGIYCDGILFFSFLYDFLIFGMEWKLTHFKPTLSKKKRMKRNNICLENKLIDIIG